LYALQTVADSNVFVDLKMAQMNGPKYVVKIKQQQSNESYNS